MSAPESFEEYVGARLAALSRTAYLLTGHHQDAEDLVQRTLVKVVAVWPRIAADPDPYVKRVMYHDNISRWRRRSRRPERLTDVLPERQVTRDDTTRLALEDALSRLTPKQRTVLVLRFYEDLTEARTAEVMGVGLGTVKSQTRHAIKRIRELAPELETLLVS
ncbi:SigE family RNA polymerase sigma factor [Nocardioides marmoribigeumensis]|uniref:RNA polymerase sigma-70 factor (Sigma-E family) n=1 Tax=Nocardioides marmoribigeumensis TaxID=433649 RepID=A0ABU2BR66_9ACTN|nr:SigE family RNA polymerase sigma factor [Nocardioides marmoribigeumensis]MDR7361142.1 RNA polymerase sigma-70 factor (sigma-E family) [Nocardioides marmoribigeumensis]